MHKQKQIVIMNSFIYESRVLAGSASVEASTVLIYLVLACFYAIMLCFVMLKVQNLQSGSMGKLTALPGPIPPCWW